MLNLDTILMHACPSGEDGPWSVFEIETHCVGFRIVARFDHDRGTYEVRDYAMYDC